MREDLVGHLLGAIEPSESKAIEMALADPLRGPSLRHDLDRLQLALEPLAGDRDVLPAPAGLAGRTMRFIVEQESAAKASASRPLPMPRGLSEDGAPPQGRGARA